MVVENWGCITYRDNRLLVDPANTSVATMQVGSQPDLVALCVSMLH
jgi:aminopeptidase N